MVVIRTNALPEVVWELDPGYFIWESQLDCVVFIPTGRSMSEFIEILEIQGWKWEIVDQTVVK